MVRKKGEKDKNPKPENLMVSNGSLNS